MSSWRIGQRDVLEYLATEILHAVLSLPEAARPLDVSAADSLHRKPYLNSAPVSRSDASQSRADIAVSRPWGGILAGAGYPLVSLNRCGP
jgi:hypothetical protein